MSFATLTITDERTRHRGLSGPGELEQAGWFRELHPCDLLEEFGIRHLGVVDAEAPYRFQRKRLSAPVFLACIAGRGHVHTGGQRLTLDAGHATLLPAGEACAYHAIEGTRWQLVWLCFSPQGRAPQAVAGGSREFAVRPLFHAVECLLSEHESPGDAINLRQSLGLIERMIARFTAPRPELARFYDAWTRVERQLGSDWSLDDISRLAACSAEQFRRLCQRELGTSPKRHLTGLRLRRAKQRLLASHDTVDAIAREAGYGDTGAFANVFRKHHGLTPAELRKNRGRGASGPQNEPSSPLPVRSRHDPSRPSPCFCGAEPPRPR